MSNLPRNAKEGIIFGVFMCLFMVLVMSFANICINMGGVNAQSLSAWGISLPIVFVVAFAVENIVVTPISNFIMNRVYKERSNSNAVVALNAIIIVTMMSLIMTFLGGVIGGMSVSAVLSGFLTSWPRNFCIAMFCNLLFAGPLARLILKGFQTLFDKKTAQAKQLSVYQNSQGATAKTDSNMNK